MPSGPRALAAALVAKAEAVAAKSAANGRRESAEHERSGGRRGGKVGGRSASATKERHEPEEEILIGTPGHSCYAPGGCWGDSCYVPSCCTTGLGTCAIIIIATHLGLNNILGPRFGRPHYLDALREVNGGSQAKIEFLRSQFSKHSRAVRALQSEQRRIAKKSSKS